MMDSIVAGHLEIKIVRVGSLLRMEWLGEADEANPAKALRPFLDRLEAQAVAESRPIAVDLTALRFMNSSCIGLIMSYLRSLDDHGVHVEVIYDTRQSWQVLSKRCTKTVFGRSERITVRDSAEGI